MQNHKTWKAGILLIGICTLFTSNAIAQNSIKDLDKLESEYLKSIRADFADKCWQNTIGGHFDKGQSKPDAIAAASQEAFTGWIEGKSIYKIHPVAHEVKADLFDNRSYILERNDGALLALEMGFRNRLGEWYIYLLHAGPDDKMVRKVLNMPAYEE